MPDSSDLGIRIHAHQVILAVLLAREAMRDGCDLRTLHDRLTRMFSEARSVAAQVAHDRGIDLPPDEVVNHALNIESVAMDELDRVFMMATGLNNTRTLD